MTVSQDERAGLARSLAAYPPGAGPGQMPVHLLNSNVVPVPWTTLVGKQELHVIAPAEPLNRDLISMMIGRQSLRGCIT